MKTQYKKKSKKNVIHQITCEKHANEQKIEFQKKFVYRFYTIIHSCYSKLIQSKKHSYC